MLARDGGMNVPNIRQEPGGVTALPRAVGDGESHAGQQTVAAAREHAATRSGAPSVSFTRLAWFDVNGDGHIDPRSAAAGGDATLLVPSDAVDLPTYSRNVTPLADTHSGRVTNEEHEGRTAPTGNPAQTNRAVEAYQRYGQTPAAQNAAPAPTPIAGAASAPPVAAGTPVRAVA
jgi:hypothetical protein